MSTWLLVIVLMGGQPHRGLVTIMKFATQDQCERVREGLAQSNASVAANVCVPDPDVQPEFAGPS